MDRKIRILILVLCIGGSALAGISSRVVYPGGEQQPLQLPRAFPRWAGSAEKLARKVLRVITENREPGESTVLGRGAATGETLTIGGSVSIGQSPGDANADPSVVPSRRRHRVKTLEELKVEQIIEAAFQKYFKVYQIEGRSLTLRMPFGLNYEREGAPGYSQLFFMGGKAAPEQLWPHIDSVLASEPFGKYAAELTSPGDKVIIFELERKSYALSRDQELIESLRDRIYPGTPTRILVLRGDAELTEVDVYNYLYSLASVGVDCTGFSHYIHDSIAQAYGMDASRMLGESWRVAPDQIRLRIGLWFYDPANGYTAKISDRIEDLRPADIILFRGSDGQLKHSAVIQSIDFENGLLRYVQSTDWAVEPERGVHKSVIRFDPLRPQVNLTHYSLIWRQQVRPPFDGELEPRDWLTDRDRYMWYPAAGGSLVVRLRYLAEIILEQEPRFYSN